MPVGRPRKFDTDQALDAALRVFWRHGFEGASLGDLTEAMGINRPSLYAAFGDKETLFRQAIKRYAELHASYLAEAMEEPTVRRIAEKLWAGGINVIRNAKNPRGCFLVQGALACSEAAQLVQQAMLKQRRKGETALKKRFEQALETGDLPPETDAADLARYVSAVSYGLAVQAAGGTSAAELEAVAAIASQALPD